MWLLDIAGILIIIFVLLFGFSSGPIAVEEIGIDPLDIVGKRVIVQSKSSRIIHLGTCEYITDTLAVCNKSNGEHFVANLKNLYWSEGHEAFIEKV